MPISIFNYEKSKLPFLIELTNNCLAKKYPDAYFLDNDWQDGPNTKIIFLDSDNETKAIKLVRDFVEEYKKNNILEAEYIEKKKQEYYKNQLRLRELEMREGDKVFMAEHCEIRITPNKSNVYNSLYHKNMFEKFRAELHPIYIRILEKFTKLDAKEQCTMFIMMYLYIAGLYEDGVTKGYLSFVSHVEGFFSRLRIEGYYMDMKSEFEKRRLSIFNDGKLNVSNEIESILNEWKLKWAEIARYMKDTYSYELFNDQDVLGLNEQYDSFYDVILKMDNNFHMKLKSKDNLKKFIQSDKMIIYRNILNLFYLMLPLFEQSMIMKQFYCYCTVKHIEQSYPKELLLEW